MTLTIKVQVDRLPDIKLAEKTRRQLGLRVSAVIEPDPDQPTQEAESDLILPWRWRADPGAANGSWNIHDKANWTIWKCGVGGVLTRLVPADFDMAVAAPGDFDPPSGTNAQGPFRERMAREVADILREAGVAALQAPVQGGRITGRTVYGLVESLSALPHPVPAAMQVWTALTLAEAVDVDDDTRFLALPAFAGSNGAAYQLDAVALPAGPDTDGAYALDYLAAAPLRDAKGAIHPSLPMSVLAIPEGDNERLIDLSTLLVRPGAAPFEGSDWNSALAARVAEAIDPSARVMAVLDDVIRAAAQDRPDETRAALELDLRPPKKADDHKEKEQGKDRLRRLLLGLHVRVAAARARSAPTGPAPALAFLESLAIGNSALWSAAMPMMLAHANAEDDAVLPTPPEHALVGRARLALLGGMELPRQDVLDEPATLPVVDGEQVFRDWLLSHWTAMPAAARVSEKSPGVYASLFAGTHTRLLRKDDTTVAQTERTGILNLMQLDWGTVLELPLSLRKEPAGLPELLEFRLAHPTAIGKVAPTFTLGVTPMYLKLNDQQSPIGPSFVDCVLTMRITVSADRTQAKQYTLGVDILFTEKDERQELKDRLDITEIARSGRLCLEVAQVVGGGVPLQVAVALKDAERERLRAAAGAVAQGQAMRTALALAYSGPAVAALMNGRAPLVNALLTADDKAAAATPAGERLASALIRYAESAEDFNRPFEDTIAEIDARIGSGEPTAAQLAALGTLKELIAALRTAAREDVARLAHRLVPRTADRDAERITQDALPLSFAIDQLQDFDDTVDLWSRLAGLGVLIGREGEGGTTWWSLNVASLHVSQPAANNARAALGEQNAVEVHSGLPGWWKRAQVDPVPLVVTEIQGVRNAVIRYESQSIVAETQKRPQMDPQGQARLVARRPEAYLFPVEKGFPKLPPLTFGRHYRILPYLIAHGGVVPPLLRSRVDDPCSWFTEPPRDPTHGGFTILESDFKDFLRSKQYRRSVPVGAPRLVSRLPGLIEGVAPLAAELPVTPTPITLRQGRTAAFFLDKEQTGGLLGCPPGMKPAEAGVHLVVGGIVPPAGGSMELRVRMRNPQADSAVLELSVPFNMLAAARDPLTDSAELALRVQVGGKKVVVHALLSRLDACAEDQPTEKALAIKATTVEPVAGWTDCAVELVSQGADVDVLPPSVQWGIQPDRGSFVLYGERGMYPAELVPRTRTITLLDGIGAARDRVWPDSATFELERPATPLATYDRWVNGPIGGYGNANPDTIGQALGHAARVVSDAAAGDRDRTLPDPAVGALVYELVQLFPTREVVKAPSLSGPVLRTERELLGTPGGSGGKGTRHTSLKVAVADAQSAKDANLRLLPGHVYELRLYGAVAQSQPVFAPLGEDSIDRFSPAVAAGWRDVTLDGKRYHLGAPLVLTLEVASELMPDLYPSAPAYLAHLPFYVSLRRPPETARDTAVLRLLPDRIPGPKPGDHVSRYQALRMIDRIAMLEQRWSWRGRPHPELGHGTVERFGDQHAIDGHAFGFVEAAFVGRRTDDVGPIAEIRIQRSHVYAGLLQFPRVPAPDPQPNPALDPVVLELDLDYRGGANLWRFAIRGRSRYAAMRPGAQAMQRFSHTKREMPEVRWLPLVVPEVPHPQLGIRKPRRPALMLVIPLTEALDADASVPPLLALFNEPMFPLFHAGDGIEAVIEVARHPFPAIERVSSRGTTRKDLVLAWTEVDAAHAALEAADARLARLQRIDATPAPGAIDAAKQELAQARSAHELAAADYARQLEAAGPAGYEQQLRAVLRDVINALQDLRDKLADELNQPDPKDTELIAYLENEIRRHDERMCAIQQEIKDIGKLPTDWGADASRSGNPSAKYWPEVGSDPIRTGKGATGKPLALRCDGPVGYTFDLGTEAGRFDHAGLLLSPVADNLRPWSMVKLRFRRLETPELLADVSGQPLALRDKLVTDPAKALCYVLASPGAPASVARTVAAALALPAKASGAREGAAARKIVPPKAFLTAHEGLAVDFPLLDAAKFAGLRAAVSFEPPSAPKAHRVEVMAAIDSRDPDAPRLLVSTSTQLGLASPWSVSLESGSKVELRLVISEQAVPRPQPGQKALPPLGDVSVRVRITPPENTGRPGSAHEHAWLSVICIPLTASASRKEGEKPLVYLYGSDAVEVAVRPIRLSEFTPGVWSQFAAVMSRVAVTAIVRNKAGGKRELSQAIPVTQLNAKGSKDGKSMLLSLRGLAHGEECASIALSAEGAPDPEAQVEERLYAVVTRYVHDAFDLMRERPLRVHPLPSVHPDGGITLPEALWPLNPTEEDPYRSGSGRIRIIRVLRGKTRDTQGFETAAREFPRDFFLDEIDEDGASADSPNDGAGQVLGISQPFEWTAYQA